MDTEQYFEALALEQSGSILEAKERLLNLVKLNHPLALIEIGFRHLIEPEQEPHLFCPGKNLAISRDFVKRGEAQLLLLAESGDGEAMRMLGYLFLDLLGPFGRSLPQAESWLLKSFQAGCHFAANDLHTFYLGSNQTQSRYWYQKAKEHNCQVVYYEQFES